MTNRRQVPKNIPSVQTCLRFQNSPESQNALISRGFSPSPLQLCISRQTVSTWHESCFYIIIHRARASTLRKRTWILFFSHRGTCRHYYAVTGTCRETGIYRTVLSPSSKTRILDSFLSFANAMISFRVSKA